MATQEKEWSSISVLLALHPANKISAKKTCEVTEGIIRVTMC